MLKKYSEFFRTAMVLSDLVLTAAAFLSAFWLRFHAPWFREGVMLPLTERFPGLRSVVLGEDPLYLEDLYLSLLFIVVPACLLIYRWAGLYQPRRSGSFAAESAAILKATVGALLALFVVAFFYRQISLSRVMVGLFAALNPLFLLFSHGLVRLLLRQARKRGYNLRRALVVGSGRVGQKLVTTLGANKWTGIRVRGFLDWRPERVGRSFCKVPVLGTLQALKDLIRDEGIEQIFLCFPYQEQQRLQDLLPLLADETADVRIVPDYLSLTALIGPTSELDGLPIISLVESPLYGWNRVFKRLFDLAVALAALVVLFLPMMLIAALIKLSSRGPIFYKQDRCGLDGRVFFIWKFRTMRADAEVHSGAVWAVKDDPRRTRLGSFLRATSLDELPQFWNVLKGEMSVVGPRPERPVFIEQFREKIPRYMLRHKTKAGITGWAQVNGWRGNTSLRKRLQYDLYYIRHWSLLFDVKIILLTGISLVGQRNAY